MNHDSKLAVQLRRCQWMLDDTAFNLPRGAVTDRQRHDLANALTELAEALRDSTAPVVDAPTEDHRAS